MRAGIEQLRAEPRLRGLTGAKTEDNSMKREDINIRDPFILTDRENGVYYLYGTRGEARRKELGYGFDVFVSRDLEEFSEPTVVFSPSDGFWGKYDFWAPEVHFYKGKYYMFASFKADGKCRATHILRSDSPMGPFVPVSDTPATPAGQECLDGTLYVEDGIPYIVYSHEWLQVKDGEMCARRLSDDLTEAVGEPILLFRASGPSWAKGYKRRRRLCHRRTFSVQDTERQTADALGVILEGRLRRGYRVLGQRENRREVEPRRKTPVLARRRARDGVPRP